MKVLKLNSELILSKSHYPTTTTLSQSFFFFFKSIKIEVLEHRWVHLSGVLEHWGRLQGSLFFGLFFLLHCLCAEALQ